MISINGLEIEYAHMGHFVGDKDWIHPDRVIDTYEIIFVTGGQVYINEGGVDYVLGKGDALVMRPGVRHYGYKKSDDTSFFWFHFYAKNYESVGDYRFKVADYYNYELLFRRLNHLATIGAPSAVIECEFALMLLNRKMELGENNKLFFEVADYIKVHIASAPTVSSIAQKFGYNPDYLSKIFIKHAGISLKKYIDSERNRFVKSLLLNTNLSVKEISDQAYFPDDGALIKFFRYNNVQTPTQFRRSYYATYTNIK